MFKHKRNLGAFIRYLIAGILVIVAIGAGYLEAQLYLGNRPSSFNNQRDNFNYVNHHTYEDSQVRLPLVQKFYYRMNATPVKADITPVAKKRAISKELDQINNTRLKYGRAPLKLSKSLSQVANKRAKQAFFVKFVQHKADDADIHEERNGTSEACILIRNILKPKKAFLFGENVCDVHFGKSSFNNGEYGMVNYHHIYSFAKMADVVNNNSVYHDQAQHNGHRFNVLNPNYKKVGIAVYYQPHMQQAEFVEDYMS